MTFNDIPAGAHVFVDANTLVYHFMPHPQFGAGCTELIKRIERQEIAGWTSTHVLTEVAHRLMTVEACNRFGWPFPGIAARLRSHRVEVRSLKLYRQAVEEVLNSPLQVLVITPGLVLAGADVSRQTGLLSNDALLLATMRDRGLADLASNDADFDGIAGLTRYAPA
jgi:predicted nucleic acid-binding protein